MNQFHLVLQVSLTEGGVSCSFTKLIQKSTNGQYTLKGFLSAGPIIQRIYWSNRGVSLITGTTYPLYSTQVLLKLDRYITGLLPKKSLLANKAFWMRGEMSATIKIPGTDDCLRNVVFSVKPMCISFSPLFSFFMEVCLQRLKLGNVQQVNVKWLIKCDSDVWRNEWVNAAGNLTFVHFSLSASSFMWDFPLAA